MCIAANTNSSCDWGTFLWSRQSPIEMWLARHWTLCRRRGLVSALGRGGGGEGGSLKERYRACLAPVWQAVSFVTSSATYHWERNIQSINAETFPVIYVPDSLNLTVCKNAQFPTVLQHICESFATYFLMFCTSWGVLERHSQERVECLTGEDRSRL